MSLAPQQTALLREDRRRSAAGTRPDTTVPIGRRVCLIRPQEIRAEVRHMQLVASIVWLPRSSRSLDSSVMQNIDENRLCPGVAGVASRSVMQDFVLKN